MRVCADEETLQSMLEAVARQRKAPEWQREAGRYIPYPARWLRSQAWLDGPCEATAEKHYENERNYVNPPPGEMPEWLKRRLAEDDGEA